MDVFMSVLLGLDSASFGRARVLPQSSADLLYRSSFLLARRGSECEDGGGARGLLSLLCLLCVLNTLSQLPSFFFLGSFGLWPAALPALRNYVFA